MNAQNFFLSLRGGNEVSQTKKNNDSNKLSIISNEDSEVIDKKLRKDRPCSLKQCLSVIAAVNDQLVQKSTVLKKIARTQEHMIPMFSDLKELDKEMTIVKQVGIDLDNQLQDNLFKENTVLKKRLDEVHSVGKALSSKVTDLETEHRRLTRVIKKLERLEQRHIHLHQIATGPENDMQDTMSYGTEAISIVIAKRDDVSCLPKKHTGTYNFFCGSRDPAWSCCMHHGEESCGCMDDQSIGVRSTLLIPPKAAPWKSTALEKVPWFPAGSTASRLEIGAGHQKCFRKNFSNSVSGSFYDSHQLKAHEEPSKGGKTRPHSSHAGVSNGVHNRSRTAASDFDCEEDCVDSSLGSSWVGGGRAARYVSDNTPGPKLTSRLPIGKISKREGALLPFVNRALTSASSYYPNNSSVFYP